MESATNKTAQELAGEELLAAELRRICAGNASALEFCALLLDVVAIYDDLIDRDVPVMDADIHRLMLIALIGLPANDFFNDNRRLLLPCMANAIASWRIANQLETERAPGDLDIAFVLRSSYVDVFVAVAQILHGDEAVERHGVTLRRAVHAETRPNYLKEKEA